jgi:hypothetical protein
MENSYVMDNISRTPVRRFLIWSCVIALIAVALAFMVGSQKGRELAAPFMSISTPAGAPPALTVPAAAVKIAPNTLPGASATISKASITITYRPGQPRAVGLYAGQMDVNDRKSNWYLYARSEQEIKWLDFYGFPTPAEDAQLKKSTDDELKALVDAGDLNAKAHQAARMAKAFFEKKDVYNASTAQGAMGYLLMEGGPYQAITVLKAYGDMLTDFAYLPADQRTEQQRKILDIYAICADDALATGKLYGDYAIRVAFNTISPTGMRNELGLKTDPLSASSFANGVATASGERIAKGLPPITIMPRPEPPSGNILSFSGNGTVVMERQ